MQPKSSVLSPLRVSFFLRSCGLAGGCWILTHKFTSVGSYYLLRDLVPSPLSAL